MSVSLKRKRILKKNNSILLYFEKPFKEAAIILYLLHRHLNVCLGIPATQPYLTIPLYFFLPPSLPSLSFPLSYPPLSLSPLFPSLLLPFLLMFFRPSHSPTLPPISLYLSPYPCPSLPIRPSFPLFLLLSFRPSLLSIGIMLMEIFISQPWLRSAIGAGFPLDTL